jgi:HSP20 family protein
MADQETSKTDMPVKVQTQTPTPPARREWFDFDFPGLFRWFEERRPMLGMEDRIRLEEEMADGVLHIRAEAPGIDPERDAEVTVDDGVLRVRVERRKEERSETEGRVRSEFRYGSFARAVSLPKGTDASKVSATYRDGILDVSVPMPETDTPTAQRVAIDHS